MTDRARLTRVRPLDLEVRGGDGRTLCGLGVPFDSPAEISDWDRCYSEVFRRGCFARTIRERGPGKVKVLVTHDSTRLPVGRATVLREDPAGLYAELRISETAAGDECLTLAKDGTLDGLSIGFVPIREQWSPDHAVREHLEVRLEEISLAAFPVYAAAKIHAVRSTPPATPRLAVARRLLDLHERT